MRFVVKRMYLFCHRVSRFHRFTSSLRCVEQPGTLLRRVSLASYPFQSVGEDDRGAGVTTRWADPFGGSHQYPVRFVQ